MTIVTNESQYLTGQYCIDKMVQNVTIITEGTEVESEYQGKKSKKVTVQVICHIAEKSQKTWEMNQSAKKMMITIFGQETKNWMGKTAKLNIVYQNNHQTIYVDELGTRALNAQNTMTPPPGSTFANATSTAPLNIPPQIPPTQGS